MICLIVCRLIPGVNKSSHFYQTQRAIISLMTPMDNTQHFKHWVKGNLTREHQFIKDIMNFSNVRQTITTEILL